MSADKMNVDEVFVDKMNVDIMLVDKRTYMYKIYLYAKLQ